jgi:predicted MFS family arabinose efflux permease
MERDVSDMLNPFNAGLGRDIKILITSMGIVSLAGGFNQVVQLVYLAMLGISPSLIGIVVSIATVGGAVRMVLFGALSDKFGRRRILFVMGFTSVVFNLIYFFARDYPFFILAAIIGGVGTEGFGGSVEWSYLAEKAGDHKRTIAFSIQNFVCSVFATLGSFATSLPEIISRDFGIQIFDVIRLFFAIQAIITLAATILLLFISKDPHITRDKEERYLSTESRNKLGKLSIILLCDGFGSGMIFPLFSLWFYIRFGLSVASLGYIFGVSKIFETSAYLLGPTMASRFGLVKAISLARLCGAISAVIMAFVPTYFLAAVMFTIRNASQHLGNPLRHSYMVAIFNRNERASAMGISETFRTAGSTVASTISGYVMQNLGTTISPLLSGVFIGVAAQLYFSLLKDIKTPEEQVIAK